MQEERTELSLFLVLTKSGLLDGKTKAQLCWTNSLIKHLAS